MGKSSGGNNDSMMGFAELMQAQAAMQNISLGQDWLSFAKTQFQVGNERQKTIDALTKQVTDAQITSMNNVNKWAGEDRARFTGVFQPLQDEFIKRANEWDSAANQQKAAAEARADVVSQAAAQDEARQRQLAARGINPGSGNWQAIDRSAGIQTGLAAAGAQNRARSILRKEGMGLRGEAINLGNNLPVQATTALQVGNQSGGAASRGVIDANNQWRGNIDIMGQGYGGAMRGYGGAADIFGRIYDQRSSTLQSQQKQQSDMISGIAGGVGSIVGMGMGGEKPWFLSDENVKEDKTPVRGVLDAVKSLRIEKWKYLDGVADSGTHIGPYAQDWKKATGLGSGKEIHVVDAIGVTMKAIQELSAKVDKLDGCKHGKRARERSILKAA